MEDSLDLGPIWDRLDENYRETLIGTADFVCTVVGVTEEAQSLSQSEAISMALQLRREHMLPSVGVNLTTYAEEWHEAIIRRLAEAMLDGRFPRPTQEDRERRHRRSFVTLIAEAARELMSRGTPRALALSEGSAPLEWIADRDGYDLGELIAEAEMVLDSN